MFLSSSQKCQAIGQEPMGKIWWTGISTWIWGSISLLYRWLSTEADCPEMLWSLSHWIYSRTVWTYSCAHALGWPWAGRLDQITHCDYTNSVIIGAEENLEILRGLLWHVLWEEQKWRKGRIQVVCGGTNKDGKTNKGLKGNSHM